MIFGAILDFMMRILAHTLVAGFLALSASAVAADEVDAMLPGLNGFRPGVGNELDSRWEPYVQQRNQEAYYNRLSPEWGRYSQRDPGLDPAECRSRLTGDPDSEIRFGYAECFDREGKTYILPGGTTGSFGAY